MKFTCLSDQVNKCCSLIRFKETHILLDAGLDMSCAANFLPLPLIPSSRLNSLRDYTSRNLQDCDVEQELKECAGRVFVDSCPEFCPPDLNVTDWREVDVILISNHMAMMALPYITEMTSFRGIIFATEPAIQIANMFMQEMIQYMERTPKPHTAVNWKKVSNELLKTIPFPVPLDPETIVNMMRLYSSKHVSSSMSKVKLIGLGEKVDLFGCLTASAHSSGHSIGSCNWIIRSEHEKIVYLSASSTMTTHPKPIEIQLLKNPDLLIISSMTSTPVHNPDSSLHELCSLIKTTLQAQGNVLLPCYTSGIIYDLIECLVQTLDQSGLSAVPIFLISPIADQSLAYSNILAEWLTQVKQNRVYLPEEPFHHSSFVRSGRVKHFSSVHCDAFQNEYKTPCIVFTGHPCLRFGEVVHFIELWSNNPANLIAITDPEFAHVEALAPFQPMHMRISFTPIDPSLNFPSVNKLIQELNPSNLLIPYTFTVPPVGLKHRTDLQIDCHSCPVFTFRKYATIDIPIRRSVTRIRLDSEISKFLQPIEIRPGVTIATVTGSLEGKDNRFKLKPLSKNEEKELQYWKPGQGFLPPRNYSTGTLDLQLFMSKLPKAGLHEAVLQHTPTGSVIHLNTKGHEEAFVTAEENTTHIVCDVNSPLRLLLRDLVAKCLKTF